jgi:hypothetical protein
MTWEGEERRGGGGGCFRGRGRFRKGQRAKIFEFGLKKESHAPSFQALTQGA